MKLNYKRTIRVGLAFAIIMLFWTAYDFVIPLLLEKAFGLSNSLRGVVMGIDNVLSLFLLPLFGKWSDKCNSKYGKRTPFLFIGTILAVVIMIFVPISAGSQLKDAGELRAEIYSVEYDAEHYSYTADNGVVYDAESLYTMFFTANPAKGYCDHEYLKLNGDDNQGKYMEIAMNGVYDISKADGKYYLTEYFDNGGEQATSKSEISKADYEKYKKANEEYEKFIEPGIAVFASEEVNAKVTQTHPERLAIYLVVLFMVLVAMASFRSPAVALMPDVTPKPLRSQGNAIINLMGGIGGAIAFFIYTIAFIISDNSFVQIFAVCAAAMVALLVAFLFLVKEPKYVEDCKRECAEYGISNDDEAEEIEIHHSQESEEVAATGLTEEQIALKKKKRDRAFRRSFFFILASTFMWFMGYNAISSNLSVYCTKVLNQTTAVASIISGASMAVSAIAFIPVGMLAVKIGRRKSVILGFSLAIVSFFLIFFFVKPDNMAKYLFAIFYLISGFGLIITNVNTFPMVLELSNSSNVGKYTGYYYVSTMSAQAITPFISGLVMDYMPDSYLFLYSAVCVVVALVFMVLVRYGDSKPLPAKSAFEYLGAGDD